jgi:hypothetical protein
MRRLAAKLLKAVPGRTQKGTFPNTGKNNFATLPPEMVGMVVDQIDSIGDVVNLGMVDRRTNKIVTSLVVDAGEGTTVKLVEGFKQVADLSEKIYQEAMPDDKLPEAHVPDAYYIRRHDTGLRTLRRVEAVVSTLTFSKVNKSQFVGEVLKIADVRVRTEAIEIVLQRRGEFDPKHQWALISTAFAILNGGGYEPRTRETALKTIIAAQSFLEGDHLSAFNRMKRDPVQLAQINRLGSEIERSRQLRQKLVADLEPQGMLAAAMNGLQEAYQAAPGQTLESGQRPQHRVVVNHRLGALNSLASKVETARQGLINSKRNRGRSYPGR